jgi:hypothetical protein
MRCLGAIGLITSSFHFDAAASRNLLCKIKGSIVLHCLNVAATVNCEPLMSLISMNTPIAALAMMTIKHPGRLPENYLKAERSIYTQFLSALDP